MDVSGGRAGRATPLRWALRVFCALVLTFLMLPLAIVFPISFSSSSSLMFPPPGWSLRWYRAYLNDEIWIEATLRSLGVAGATMVLSTVLGIMLAFALVRGRFPGKAMVNQLATAPLIVPTIIYAVAIYGLFAWLKLIGLWQGIVLGHVVHALPLVVLVVGASLRTVDANLELAAEGLGASRWTAIRRVTLPQIRPAIVSGAFLSFIASFDELVIAMFLGGSNWTLPKKMFDNIQLEIEPTVAAVSVLQILLVTIVLALAARFGAGATPVSAGSEPKRR
ncbi:MAG: ABC transporter permease [Alphaproteobacteria bacterium]|nr:ABC transporter permease [Alphaproteobacteria bacterium]